jgi:putative transposase
MGVRRASHAVYDCEYHLVWCPKYLKKVFGQEYLRKRAKELFSEIAEEYDLIIEELEVAADHVHILVSFPPRYSISTVVKTLKSISARELFREHPSLRKRFWKGELWEDGYFARTVGDKVTTDIIKQYIKYHEAEKQSPAQLDIFKLR